MRCISFVPGNLAGLFQLDPTTARMLKGNSPRRGKCLLHNFRVREAESFRSLEVHFLLGLVMPYFTNLRTKAKQDGQHGENGIIGELR